MPTPTGLSGGAALEQYLAGIVGRVAPAGVGPSVRAGFLEGPGYPEGPNFASVAAWNEFGTSRAPPRPFFRQAIKAGAPQWGAQLGKVLTANGMDGPAALTAMGQVIAGQIRQSIQALTSPPLAPSTIAAKSRGGVAAGWAGPEKPLIHTGDMWDAVDYEVTA